MNRYLIASTIVFAAGCPSQRPPLQLPSVPRPIEALNTPFNDFNSAAPDHIHGRLVFSTDRGSGRDYDLWQAGLHFRGKEVHVDHIRPYEPAAMSSHDELGPTLRRQPDASERLVFASDRPGGMGGFDLYEWRVGDGKPTPMPGVNTPGFEGYWTELDTSSHAYFASDRDGQGLDAYRLARSSDVAAAPERVAELSSPADDTAFHLYRGRLDGRLYMLFASNRDGGQGDFDLYCAAFDDASRSWMTPRPLRYASSPYKDFRPIVLTGFQRDVLIFSSNRPGGRGGMDLYYAAVDLPCAEEANQAAAR